MFKEEQEFCRAVFEDKGRGFKLPDEVRDAQSIRIIKALDEPIVLRE